MAPNAPTAPPPAHVVVFGRPGSGKSSLAERLGADAGYTLVRTGEMLREAVRRGDDLGHQVQGLLARGDLAPDDVIADVLERDLEAPGHDRLLFDGFPRTLGQAAILERLEAGLGFRVDLFLDVAIRREAASTRMTGRRVCPACGATYHLVTKPPRVAEHCDVEGALLQRRPDDAAEIVNLRQHVFDQQTAPVVSHYRAKADGRFVAIDGDRAFDPVYADARRALGLA